METKRILTMKNCKYGFVFSIIIFFITACADKVMQYEKQQESHKISTSNKLNDSLPMSIANTKDYYANAYKNPTDNLPILFKYLQEVGLQDEDGYYLIEGDILLTEAEVDVWFRSKNIPVIQNTDKEESQVTLELLLRLTSQGERDYWKTSQERHLTYAIDKNSFTNEEYLEVISRMNAAGNDWNQLCDDCNIKFEHLVNYDNSPSHDNVKFIVKRVSNVSYIASAFFPEYPQSRRYVNIASSFFSSDLSFDQTGVLRHELGHVLGYRHEHIQGIRGCGSEGGKWVPLTEYDEHSVMHYYCGSGGSLELALTASDKEGHRKVYKVN